MLKKLPVSLNKISHDSAMELIQKALDKGYNVTKVYLDTVGPPDAYKKKLIEKFSGSNH